MRDGLHSKVVVVVANVLVCVYVDVLYILQMATQDSQVSVLFNTEVSLLQ